MIHITELAAVAEGAGVLAAFGTAVEIMVHSFMGGSWPWGRKGAAMRKMVLSSLPQREQEDFA